MSSTTRKDPWLVTAWVLIFIFIGCCLILVACDSKNPGTPVKGIVQEVTVFHDDKYHVTCWVLKGGVDNVNTGISCIADSDLDDSLLCDCTPTTNDKSDDRP